MNRLYINILITLTYRLKQDYDRIQTDRPSFDNLNIYKDYEVLIHAGKQFFVSRFTKDKNLSFLGYEVEGKCLLQ